MPLSNKSRDVWSECDKMKVKNYKMASMVDGNSDSCSIAGMFSDKYGALYNSVPYDNTEMKRIEAEVMTSLQKCNDNSYNITVHDVMNAVTHLKTSKIIVSQPGCCVMAILNVRSAKMRSLVVLFSVQDCCNVVVMISVFTLQTSVMVSSTAFS